MGSKRSDFGDGASPDTFVKYFGKYGEITDSVIMKDRHTGRPRGFGFITYADPSVVDTVIAENIINGKQVEIKRTIPKGSGDSKDFKTKKIFVGGIPLLLLKVVEHEIIRDHVTKRSRGFGFIVFDSEQVVDSLLADGNMIDMAGTQVEIKKAEPKKPSNPTPAPAYGSDSRARAYGDSYGGFGSSYSSFGSGGFGPASYRSMGSGLGVANLVIEEMAHLATLVDLVLMVEASEGGYGGGLGAYGRGGGYGSYGGAGSGAGYESGPSAGYGGAGGGMYGGRAGYSGSSRYHPYAR
ncbi:Heterogeneous nuclear ribonucleoprotein 1 [Sesamum angolense]|uniref:Heterogeneous nuclear ribonucleoprotein 1 n=1 Tax=Sesamum angolense TaxID=2727404 RepID=A0AAE2BVF9_9LAMI|nr:Heterogeneous nuclear ribonucleoprotein 1 [Sesamum angolense]